MVKISSIFVLGILVAITPFSGFSLFWKEFIYISCGLFIVGLSILIRKELHEVLRSLHSDNGVKNNTFSESSPDEKK